jgi:hypothetical protein
MSLKALLRLLMLSGEHRHACIPVRVSAWSVCIPSSELTNSRNMGTQIARSGIFGKPLGPM